MAERIPATGWNVFDDSPPFVLEEILLEWRALLASSPPWDAMPLDDLDGLMPRILPELLDLAHDLDHAARRHRMVVASRAHGAFRRAQRCPSASVRSEFTRLGLAVTTALQRGGFRNRFADDVLTCLEPDLNLARLAADRGFETQ